jgi:uncharacterized Zn-finger protein
MHQRIHKGVRPFQCAPCGVFFRQKAHLQKHQKTQGHIQATEIYEKKKRDGLLNEDTGSSGSSAKGSSPGLMNQMRPESVKSVDSNGSSNGGLSSSGVLSLTADSSGIEMASSSFSPKLSSPAHVKSSPKRKQAKPSQLLVSENNNEDETEAECRVSTSEDKLNAFIDYNDISHGYDCNQCTFASHELATMKDHVRDEHMAIEREDKLKCRECQITFSKEFNLRIHNRKHETSSQFLPCDHCEQVFKVPNKLIKHMEAVHSVCPTCGDRQEDKASLLRHLEDVHDQEHATSSRKGFHANLLQFTPLNLMSSSPSSISLESRIAKRRKVDSLAESLVIRAKQELKSKALSPATALQQKKHEAAAAAVDQPQSTSMNEAISASLLHLQPQPLSKISPELLHHHKHRSIENNNVLSSLKLLPPTIRLPTKPLAGLTPPSSPPPSSSQIRGEVSVTIVSPSGVIDNESDNEAEPAAGLDLSIGKRRNSDSEQEVTTTASPLHPSHDGFYGRLPLPAPHPHPHLPFPFLAPLHPGTADPAIAEHFLKLASLHQQQQRLPPPPPPSAPHELPKTSSPYTVLSAMLGHSTPHYPTVFPGMPPVFPPAVALQAPPVTSGSPSTTIKEEPGSLLASAAVSGALPSSTSSVAEKKPFVCNFCRKEFGHLSSLESHMDHMHSGDAKHSCEACGKSFSSKSNLTAHKKIHSGERPFECLVCHKRFRQKAHLQKHETTHSSATPYQCSVCDKAFGHISNLNTHMATHSNVRPYQCLDCGKSYKDSASFKRHRLGHTGERPYSCDLCEETFIDSKAVRRHRELVHPNELPSAALLAGTDMEEEVDDDEDTLATPSTSAYSSFESGKEKDEEIEVEKEMAEDEEDS